MTTYEALMIYKIAGNHHHDSDFLNSAEEFIKDDTKPLSQRANIVRKFDEAVGYDAQEDNDGELVADFLRNIEE